MRFFFLLPCILFAFARADDEAAKEVHLNELIPNRVFNALDDGWQKSLAYLQVKDVLALPKLYSSKIDFTSRKSIENAVSSVSPNLHKVLLGTEQALKDKHDARVGKLNQGTKDFGAKVLRAFKGFTGGMLKLYGKETRQVKLDIRENYPHVDKVIQALFKKQAQDAKNKSRRPKRSANSGDEIDYFATMLLNIFA